MAFGGGTFTVQNKMLPGAYINFISAARASAMLSDRGIVAMPLELNWGPDGEVFAVTEQEFRENARAKFGYAYTDNYGDCPAELLQLREIFANARLLYAYRLGASTKATNEFATAKYGGTRGNDIQIVIAVNVDDATKFDVTTLLGSVKIDQQTVVSAANLTDNDFIVWKKDAVLKATAGTALIGGTNGTVTGDNYQDFLNKIESYSFHTLGCPSADEKVKRLFIAFTKRLRDEVGAKFQTVGYHMDGADYEGVISVDNKCTGTGEPEYGLVYWTAGVEAGCAVNKSCGNKAYSGEYTVDTNYTQLQLEQAMKLGKLVFHSVDGEPRILSDLNTFTSFTTDKNDDFGSNQVIRVLDQIANDTAALFNTRYLDKVQNDKAGRVSFWSDLVKLHEELQQLRAIENFDSKDIAVEKGESKRSVTVQETVTPVCAMEQLYMNVVVA